MKHKPSCSTNISCAVYHYDGVCSAVRKCDCGAEPVSKPMTEDIIVFVSHVVDDVAFQLSRHGNDWALAISGKTECVIRLDCVREHLETALSDERTRLAAEIRKKKWHVYPHPKDKHEVSMNMINKPFNEGLDVALSLLHGEATEGVE